jgi:SagB-type dehydrogenase family enzyme
VSVALYRRAPALVGYWEDGGAVLRNYASRTSVPLTPDGLSVLASLSRWQTFEDLRAACPRIPPRLLRGLLSRFAASGAVEETGRRTAPPDLGSWEDWGPSAAFFHFDTKDVTFADRDTMAVRAGRRLAVDPPREREDPPPSIALPAYRRRSGFPSVLLARRSWRRFGKRRLSLAELSTLLGLTWGVQRWMEIGESFASPLKTSPSGGACHSLEVYVVVRSVNGLAPGLYRYGSDAHGLTRIGPRWSAARIARSVGGQTWASGAGAMFFMTSVFERVQWKYKFARAYRAVLLEAGHFCQTFCLAATWLRLAPFCTVALADSMIERTLGIDGVNESVVYAMGVGTRPVRTSWAPCPDGTRAPATRSPRAITT